MNDSAMKHRRLRPGIARCGLVRAVLLVLALSVGAVEAAVQSHEEIADAARDFLQEQAAAVASAPEVTVGHLDSRLRLEACDAPLEAFLPPGSRPLGKVTVGVRCAAPKPWSLYVQAQVKVLGPVVISARPLGRGAVLSPGDLETAEQDLAQLSGGYLSELTDALGMTLKRSVRAGMPLTAAMLEAPRLIRRGDRVTIVAHSGSLEVRMAGEALAEGGRNDLIRVRNLSSKREVEAEVVSPGVVRVRM